MTDQADKNLLYVFPKSTTNPKTALQVKLSTLKQRLKNKNQLVFTASQLSSFIFYATKARQT